MNVPGSESMVFHGIFPCAFENLTVVYSGKDVFRSYSQVLSRPGQVQSRRHGLVPRRNTKAYFLRNNAGCYQLCNNHRLPVRSQSMAVKFMRIDSVAHRLLRELIADCLGHTLETHVRSFINKGHFIKYSTKLPALSFHLEKLRLCA